MSDPTRTPEDLDLTQAEWSVILDANNGHLCMTDLKGQRTLSSKDELWPNVVDHIRLNRADLAHETHGDVLLTKMEALSDADWDIIMAVVEGFWELSDDPNKSRVPGRRP